MAAFATFALAEERAVAKVKDGTWINAHACIATAETVGHVPQFAVRVQRKMSATHPDYGAWVEITDDATV